MKTTTTLNETWYCMGVQFWKDGVTHIKEMDDIFSSTDITAIDECFPYLINRRLSSMPSYLVYDGVILMRDESIEAELIEMEAEPVNQFKSLGFKLLGIWRYSFKDIG